MLTSMPLTPLPRSWIPLSTAYIDQPSEAPPTDIPYLRAVLSEYRDLFRESLPKRLPPHRHYDHPIPTSNAKPVNINAYRLSHDQLQEQHRQIMDLLDKGLI